MIHEILLSLSGHPSPLFEDGVPKGSSEFPLLSPSEKALLKTIGHLSTRHRNIRQSIQLINANHRSPICKSVASTIENLHLANFQKKILDVEESILKHDASVVGAYNIVPLASIVSEFAEWHRLLDWLWEIVCFIQPLHKTDLACSGQQLINRLRKSAQTGYPDIEEAAIQLSKAAEAAWLRLLANWILYGQLSKYGSSDFFIQPVAIEQTAHAEYEISQTRIPSFVSQDCAVSILFVGNALNQISSRVKESKHSEIQTQLDLLPAHQRILSSLRLPISSPNLSEAVESIRTSLSRNVLQKLLPLEEVLKLLAILRRYFLLDQGEFGNSLIREADERMQLRTRQLAQNLGAKDNMRGMVLKEAEVTSVLSKTWIHLSALAGNDDDELDLIEMGRDLIRLSVGRSSGKSSKDASVSTGKINKNVFANFLFPVPTALDLTIEGTFDLFISSPDVQAYSSLNAYLLAIRRGHIHLADLWKQSQIRREHPTPMGPPRSCTNAGRKILQSRRARSRKRCVEMRKVWATCSAVIFLLNELGDYFEGQVIPSMWNHLLTWIRDGPKVKDIRTFGRTSISSLISTSLHDELLTLSLHKDGTAVAKTMSHDPASLSKAHQTFLASLSDSILITDSSFTSALSSLLLSVDDLVAQILRLQTIQRNLDLEEDDGVFDAMGNYAQDLKDCWIELDRARKKADYGTREIVARLRGIGNSGSVTVGRNDQVYGSDDYQPFTQVKLEWLLMKLEYSSHENDDRADLSGTDDD
jgi:hypothetical protein